MQSENQAKVERRRFFRVDDEAKLIYQRQGKEPLDRSMSKLYPLLAGLEVIHQDSSKQLHRIERSYPEVATYIKTLESKLDFIARGLLLTQEPELIQQHNHRISISATGVALNVETRFSEGEILDLKMVLLSSMLFIVNPVKVIYCEKSASDTATLPYRMGVDFIDMDEPMQEQLIRHVFNRQQQQRRRSA